MTNNKENCTKPQCRIKLLADKNVVLVEADDYESEIFTPQVVGGRITLLNIIPNRRCCKNTNVKDKLSNKKIQGIRGNTFRYSKGQSTVLMTSPLANSTPANGKQGFRCDESYNINVGSYIHASSNNSTLPTPEPVRRAVTEKPHVLEKSLLNLPKGIKVARIYPTPNETTPKNVGRLIGSSPNISRLNSSFGFMTSPIISRITTQNKLPMSRNSNTGNIDSITRWRKVLTPVRTYTKTSKKPVMLQRPVIVASVTWKSDKPSNVTPTYLVNPTKGPTVTQCIEIKKVKLIKDVKLCISPKTFKRQQQEKFYNCQIKLKPLAIPKSRRCRDIWAMSAFDLLTNSNRNRCLSSKLNKQFRKGCVNKASSTYSKYKILSTIPPLQQDDQIKEISRISMQADKMLNKRITVIA